MKFQDFGFRACVMTGRERKGRAKAADCRRGRAAPGKKGRHTASFDLSRQFTLNRRVEK